MNAISKNLDGYGTPPIAWERVRDTLTPDITQAPDTGGWRHQIRSHAMTLELRDRLHR